MKTLYISDLDGTLLDSNSRLSTVTVDLINAAIRKGALFSVATARTPATVSLLLERLNLNLPLAVMTGAVLWNPQNNQYSEPKFIPEKSVRELVGIYSEMNLPTFVFTLGADHILHIYHIGSLSEQERIFIDERKDSPYKRFHVPESGTSVLPEKLDNVLLFYSIQPTGHSRPVYDVVKQRNDINPLFYHDIYGPEIAVLEIFSPHASKADAARRIATIAGAERIVAFGDNINDLPVIGAADVGVAVANAVPEVIDAADLVIGQNIESAVPKFILNDMAEN